MLAPSGFRSLQGNFAALLCGHGSQAALAADLAASTSHCGHDAGDGIGDFSGTRFGNIGSSRTADHLESSLVYVERAGGFAYALSHDDASMTQTGCRAEAVEIQSSALPETRRP
jgi:hypothetical protein